MMDHFVLRYIPGGMTLYHSGWWLCKMMDNPYSGVPYEAPIKMIKKADYV